MVDDDTLGQARSGAFMIPAIRNLSPALAVVSNDTVRDHIVSSLRALGLCVTSTEHVDQCIAKLQAGPTLVFLHPDGFRFDQVVGILFALRRERPDVHTVLVTERPDRYMKLIVAADNAPPPSVVTMSMLASTILETAAMVRFDGYLGVDSNAG